MHLALHVGIAIPLWWAVDGSRDPHTRMQECRCEGREGTAPKLQSLVTRVSGLQFQHYAESNRHDLFCFFVVLIVCYPALS